MLFACVPLDETISDHFALAGTSTGSCSSKPWFADRKRPSACWALAEREDMHRLCFVPTVSLIWLMQLGFTVPSLQVWSRPYCTEDFPQYRTLSPGLWQQDGNPLALHFLSWNWCSQCWSHKLKVWGMIISGDIINSWIDLNSDLWAGNIKRRILLIPRMFCGSARNETQSKRYQNKLHWVNAVSSELSLASQLLSLKADEARQVQSPFLLFSIVQSKQGTEMLSPFAQWG